MREAPRRARLRDSGCFRCCGCLVAMPLLLLAWGLVPRRASSASPDGRYEARLCAPRLTGALLSWPVTITVVDRQEHRNVILSSDVWDFVDERDEWPVRVIWATDSRAFAAVWRRDTADGIVTECGERAIGPSGWVHVGSACRRDGALASALLSGDGRRRREAVRTFREMPYAAGAIRGPTDGYREIPATCERVLETVTAADWLEAITPTRGWLIPAEPPSSAAGRSAPAATAWLAWNERYVFLRLVTLWQDGPRGDAARDQPSGEVRVAIGPVEGAGQAGELLIVARADGGSAAYVRLAGGKWRRAGEGVEWAVLRKPYSGGTRIAALVDSAEEGTIYSCALPWPDIGLSREPTVGDALPFALTATVADGARRSTYVWFADLRLDERRWRGEMRLERRLTYPIINVWEGAWAEHPA